MQGAESLFHLLQTQEGLLRLLHERWPEDQMLEYIDYANDVESYNVANIAKPICGFSNAAGGVICYGVTRELDDKQRDVPKGFKPMLPKFQERVTKVAARTIQPPIANLSFKSVADGAGNEVLVVLVPESQTKPHHVRDNERAAFYYRVDAAMHLMDATLIDLHYRARHARELNMFPLLAPDFSQPFELMEPVLRLTLVNRGNSAALNVRARLGMFELRSTPVVGPLQAWRIDADENSQKHRKQEWSCHFQAEREAGVQRTKLEVTYVDLSGASYDGSFQLSRSPTTGAFEYEGPMTLTRNGVRLIRSTNDQAP